MKKAFNDFEKLFDKINKKDRKDLERLEKETKLSFVNDKFMYTLYGVELIQRDGSRGYFKDKFDEYDHLLLMINLEDSGRNSLDFVEKLDTHMTESMKEKYGIECENSWCLSVWAN